MINTTGVSATSCKVKKQYIELLRFKVHMVASMKMTVFFVDASHILIEIAKCFRDTYYTHHQSCNWPVDEDRKHL